MVMRVVSFFGIHGFCLNVEDAVVNSLFDSNERNLMNDE